VEKLKKYTKMMNKKNEEVYYEDLKETE